MVIKSFFKDLFTDVSLIVADLDSIENGVVFNDVGFTMTLINIMQRCKNMYIKSINSTNTDDMLADLESNYQHIKEEKKLYFKHSIGYIVLNSILDRFEDAMEDFNTEFNKI